MDYELKGGITLNDTDFERMSNEAANGKYPGKPGEWIVKPQDSDEGLANVAAGLRGKLAERRESSIIAVCDAMNRYLLFFDEGWRCDFFPYCRTVEPVSADMEQAARYLSDTFGISRSDFTLHPVDQRESAKPYMEHDGEERHYIYRLYRADVTRMPDAWQTDRFTVGMKQCRWMTTEEMLDDPRIREVNSDVVGMVRNTLT